MPTKKESFGESIDTQCHRHAPKYVPRWHPRVAEFLGGLDKNMRSTRPGLRCLRRKNKIFNDDDWKVVEGLLF